MYEHLHGRIPEGLWVLHRCDVKPCVNPEHLYLGDGKQNQKDALDRGRRATGKDHHWSKNASFRRGESSTRHTLTEVQVKEILRLNRTGHTQAQLAKRFNVSRQNIWRIVHGRAWIHVTIQE